MTGNYPYRQYCDHDHKVALGMEMNRWNQYAAEHTKDALTNAMPNATSLLC